MAGRKDYQVRLACPIHGENVTQTLRNATYTETKEYPAECRGHRMCS
jgi:hypothetical protein